MRIVWNGGVLGTLENPCISLRLFCCGCMYFRRIAEMRCALVFPRAGQPEQGDGLRAGDSLDRKRPPHSSFRSPGPSAIHDGQRPPSDHRTGRGPPGDARTERIRAPDRAGARDRGSSAGPHTCSGALVESLRDPGGFRRESGQLPQCMRSPRFSAWASRSGKRSGVQAKAGTPSAASAAAFSRS